MSAIGSAKTLTSTGETVEAADATYLALPELRPGTVVDRYILLGRLGAGGMGVVHAAYDPQLDRKVALKLVRDSEHLPTDTRHERLLREARAMARLDHSNVIRVFDAGTTTVRDKERVFVAMELVNGTPLATWASDRPWHQVIEACIAAGRGLAAAHAAGLVHRDFKPDNVLVDQRGVARVGDFGLVGLPGEISEDRALTQAGAVMGTPAFMAPEQKRGEAVDARADQFAFCLVVRTLVTRLPRSLEPILERGLSETAADRYPTMDDVLEAIERRLHRRGRVGWAIGIAMLIAGVGTVLALRSPQHEACATLAGVWDSSARGSLAARSAPTAAAIELYANTWRNIENQRCSSRDHGPVESCLLLRRSQLAAVVSRLGRATDLEDAVAIVDSLPAPTDCGDPSTLATVAPQPSDPWLRERVAIARGELAAAFAYRAVGRLDTAEHILALVQPLAFGPLLAEIADERAALAAARRDTATSDVFYSEAIRYAAVSGYESQLVRSILDRAFDLKDHSEAARWYDLAESWIHRLGDPVELVTHLHTNRAWTLEKAGDLTGAIRESRSSYDMWLGHDGPGHQRTIEAAINLGNAMLEDGDEQHARPIVDAALRAAEQRYTPEDETIRNLLHLQINITSRLHDLDAAQTAIERLRTIQIALHGNEHPDVRMLQQQLAVLLAERGKHADAIALLEGLKAGATDQEQIGIYHNLAMEYSQAGRANDALREADRALEAITAAVGSKHPALVATRTLLGQIQLDAGLLREAEATLRSALVLAAKVMPADSPAAANTFCTLAQTLVAEKRYAEASTAASRALTLSAGKKPSIEAEAQLALAGALSGLGRSTRANEAAARARDLFAAQHDERGLTKARAFLVE